MHIFISTSEQQLWQEWHRDMLPWRWEYSNGGGVAGVPGGNAEPGEELSPATCSCTWPIGKGSGRSSTISPGWICEHLWWIFFTLSSPTTKPEGTEETFLEFSFFSSNQNHTRKHSMPPLANHFPSMVGFYHENQTSQFTFFLVAGQNKFLLFLLLSGQFSAVMGAKVSSCGAVKTFRNCHWPQ